MQVNRRGPCTSRLAQLRRSCLGNLVGERQEVLDGEDMALLVTLIRTNCNAIFIRGRQSVADAVHFQIWRTGMDRIENPQVWPDIGDLVNKHKGTPGKRTGVSPV